MSKTGQKIYKNMERVQKGDLVLHFYKDSPFGQVEDYFFCGLSLIAKPVSVVAVEPPQPGDWAGRGSYFRIEVEGFAPLPVPLSISEFIERVGPLLFDGPPGHEPSFVLNDGRVRLAQGKYLAQCSEHLYELLSTAVPDSVMPQAGSEPTSAGKAGDKPSKPFDYEGYVEGQRARRETQYFIRNPQLVRDAKAHFGPQCQACSFRYPDRYKGLGEGYIEIHHLNPLSEQNTASVSPKLSRLSQVTALCANCHRMIHCLIRKEGRPVTLAEFKGYLTGST